MSSPRFSPWLIPEITMSGLKSMSPAASIPSSFVNTIRIYQASSRVAGESFEQGFDSTIRLTHRMATLAERHPLRGAQCVTVKPPDVVLYASTPTKQQH